MIPESAARIVMQYLVDSDIATLAASKKDWPITVGGMADFNKNWISVIDTTPRKDGRYMEGETVWKYAVNFFIRGEDQPIARRKGVDIINALDAVRRNKITVDGVVWLLEAVTICTGLAYVGESQDQLQEFSFDMRATISPG